MWAFPLFLAPGAGLFALQQFPRSRCPWNTTVAPLTGLVYVPEGRLVVPERRDEVRTWRVCGVNF
jgi:hypothetical protein